MAKLKTFESKLFVDGIEWSSGIGENPVLKVDFVSTFGRSKLVLGGDSSTTRAFKRAYEKNRWVKIIIEVEVSDVEEARELLSDGKNTQAITKALDILERLDK